MYDIIIYGYLSLAVGALFLYRKGLLFKSNDNHMKILDIKSLVFPEVKVIKFARFTDNRGYFTETYRFQELEQIIPELKIKQVMESHSKKGVLRGFHLQYDPPMGKLVRTVVGEMIDFFLDLREDSRTFGFIGAYRMPSRWEDNYDEWIWIPPGFAHGNLYLQESTIEYFATSTYNPKGEIGIYPLDKEINWTLAPQEIQKIFNKIKNKILISEKDRNGLTLKDFKKKFA